MVSGCSSSSDFVYHLPKSHNPSSGKKLILTQWKMEKFLARFRAGLMGWGERRGEPGGTGEAARAADRGRGEGEREAARSSVGDARGEQPGVDNGDSSAIS